MARGLAAADLQDFRLAVRGPHADIKHRLDFSQGAVCAPAGVGKTDRTTQVARSGHFDQCDAAFLAVIRAQTTIEGATPPRFGLAALGRTVRTTHAFPALVERGVMFDHGGGVTAPGAVQLENQLARFFGNFRRHHRIAGNAITRCGPWIHYPHLSVPQDGTTLRLRRISCKTGRGCNLFRGGFPFQVDSWRVNLYDIGA